MNRIAEAADTLRNGWCKHSIKESAQTGDKFCAVGALGKGITQTDRPVVTAARPDDETSSEYLAWREEYDAYNEWESSLYEAVQNSDEAKVIAQTIMEQYPDHDFRDTFVRLAEAGAWDEILYIFNDNAQSVDEVVEIFDKAASIWGDRA